jgi:hypothetical protein
MPKCKLIIVGGGMFEDLASGERMLLREHAPETISWIGPWLERYVRYWGVPPPAEMVTDVVSFASYNVGVTMHVYNDYPPAHSQMWGMVAQIPKANEKAKAPKENYSNLKFDEHKTVQAGGYVPIAPTQDFLGNELNPWSTSIIRWLTIFRYPDNISIDEGEDWFINVHSREVMKQPGLLRYFSYRMIEFTDRPNTPWHRVSEQWYAGFQDWYKAAIQSPPDYTRPGWARYGQYPFFEPYKDFAGAFILERPTHDLLRDYMGYVIGP